MDAKELGRVAQELLDGRDKLHRTQGGITPQQLQEMAHKWGDTVNPNFDEREPQQLLRDLADEYVSVVCYDGYDVTVQEWAAAVALVAMQVAGQNVFDLYEALYEYLGMTLENVVVRAREVANAENSHQV